MDLYAMIICLCAVVAMPKDKERGEAFLFQARSVESELQCKYR